MKTIERLEEMFEQAIRDSQGIRAIRAGKAHEDAVEEIFRANGYVIMTAAQWNRKSDAIRQSLLRTNPRIVLKQFGIRNNLSNTHTGRVDFLDLKNNRLVECKFQNVTGTAKDKIFATNERLVQSGRKSIIVYGGAQLNGEFIESAKSNARRLCMGSGLPNDHIMYRTTEEFQRMF